MEPYSKPGERRVGANRPRVQHVSPDQARETTRAQRERQKREVAAERRSIKKAARRDLKRQLDAELDDRDR